jgi:glucokinase
MPTSPNAHTAIGIDIGGTHIKACLLDSRGQLLLSEVHDTPPDWQGPQLLDLIAVIYDRFSARQGICGVGLGLPAAVQQPSGLVLGKANLRCLDDYPIGQRVRERLGTSCQLDNDANQALRAEAHFGVAKGFTSVLGLTLGTAIGGGLILGGLLWEGASGTAGELGMTYLSVPSNQADSWSPTPIEAIASAVAIEKRAQKSCAEVFQAAAAGDPQSSRILDEAFQVLAMAITNVHLLLDLELVVLGGGMAKAGQALKEGVVRAFRQFCPLEHSSKLQFELSTLGSFAGAMGAACMVLESEGHLRSLANPA